MGLLRAGSLCATLVLLTAAVSSAQELNGRVTDDTGAVLPGVSVTVTQTDTSLSRTAVTDNTGTYAIPNLPTGPYRLEVSLQGFRTYVQTGIVLQVGAAPTINAVLAVGNLEETVSVESAAPIVDVRSAGISEVVEQERIVELPLQGRQVTDLIVLAGAAVETGRPNSRSFQGGVSISVGGSLDFGVAYVLDGAMHNDPQNSGSLALPFPDALQEFRVATSGLSAQNGMHSGASVHAVTKSGTNVLHGNAFEFLRDKRFNATQVFAGIGPDGKRKDDGLRRNQFGGTLGGPILRDRLFFFGGYQGTKTEQTPAGNISFVPTAAMMAGDFTTFASPACNGGRQITLRGGFVNNRVDPALFSPAGVNLAKRLPATTDACGKITWALPNERSEGQAVTKVDYQMTGNHSMFGRYMYAFDNSPSPLTQTDNILASFVAGTANTFQALTLGETAVFGANTVNSFRIAFNRTDIDRANQDFFQPSDLGIKVYNYSPVRETVITVTDGFRISQLAATRGLAATKAYQIGDDLTLVRGRHQIGLGANIAYWDSSQRAYAQGSGTWTFNGQATGLGLADMLMGRVAILEHGGYVGVTLSQWYQGAYIQDAWRASDRVTVNGGLRWEPFSGQQITDGAIANFSLDKFRQGVKSTQFVNAPAGFMYPGDPDFPKGRAGFAKRWWNLSPRAGVAWNVTGDGRLAVRSSYALGYDFPIGEYWFRPAGAPPYGNQNRLQDPTGLFDDPYAQLGGDPHPIVTSRTTVFPPFGTFHVMDPNIQPPRVQSWNVTVERQLGPDWGVSASYLGSYSDRIWGLDSINPGLFLGLGPCTINGVSYPVCTTNNNLNQRRALFQVNPKEAQLLGSFDLNESVGTQQYRGLKLAFQRRSAAGLSLNGNYTLSRCVGLEWSNPGGAGEGYTNPADPNYDRGHCTADRTHLANLTIGAQAPQFSNAALRILASGWRASGILNVRSGSWLSVTTGQTAFNGVNLAAGLRVNKVSDDVYGAKTLASYLNRAAFADPSPGTYGDLERNSIRGPGFWKIDLSLSRVFATSATQRLEIRAEAFNLLNNFNWGNPIVLFNSANFGRILTQTGDPRIVQFGIKYGF